MRIVSVYFFYEINLKGEKNERKCINEKRSFRKNKTKGKREKHDGK